MTGRPVVAAASLAVKMRLQKFLAETGTASRRASEAMIVAGRVTVNGQPVVVLGSSVDSVADRVAVDGQLVRPQRKHYLVLNKPPGFLCTCQDPQRRPTFASLLPREWHHLYPVGRLDADSEGLIFLTNDGQFCLRLTHPRYGIRKVYRVTVAGRVEPGMLARLIRGVESEGEHLRVEKARLLRANNSQSLVEVVLAEGKNREVRRLLAALGLEVERLERVQIGPIKLGELPPGKWRVLTEPEIKSLVSEL